MEIRFKLVSNYKKFNFWARIHISWFQCLNFWNNTRILTTIKSQEIKLGETVHLAWIEHASSAQISTKLKGFDTTTFIMLEKFNFGERIWFVSNYKKLMCERPPILHDLCMQVTFKFLWNEKEFNLERGSNF